MLYILIRPSAVNLFGSPGAARLGVECLGQIPTLLIISPLLRTPLPRNDKYYPRVSRLVAFGGVLSGGDYKAYSLNPEPYEGFTIRGKGL